MISSKKCLAIILATFLSPLLLMGLLNYMVDPYNVNRQIDMGLSKEKISYRANYRLYKMQAFANEPCENILLGDSRIDALDTREIEEQTGQKWFNFAYGGGSAYEIIDTFWYATEYATLKRVYIGMNFNLYNAANHQNLVVEAKRILGNQLIYYFSAYTTKISLYNLCYKVFGINFVSEKPQMDKEAFWRKQLEESTKGFYGHYIYPKDLYKEMREISAYCQLHDIELVIIIPPTHVDLQNKVSDYGLMDEYIRYKKDMCTFGKVFDFDIDNEDNRNYELYLDPYHADEELKGKVLRAIWGKQHGNMLSPLLE